MAFVPSQFEPPEIPRGDNETLPPLDQLGRNFARAMIKHNHVVAKASKEINISATIGHRLSESAVVQEYITQLQVEADHRTQIDEDYVRYKLQDIVENCMLKGYDTIRRYDEDAKRMVTERVESEFIHDPANASRALELLGKTMKMFVDRIEKKEDITVYVNAPARPSLEDWQKQIRKDPNIIAISESLSEDVEVPSDDGEAEEDGVEEVSVNYSGDFLDSSLEEPDF